MGIRRAPRFTHRAYLQLRWRRHMKPIAISKLVVGATLALAASAVFAGEITLFERPDFQGRRLTIRGTMSNLDRTDFNDRAESIAVRDGVWEVCTDAYFNGQCVRLQPGEYPNLRGSLDRSISSARFLRDAGSRTDIRTKDGRPGPVNADATRALQQNRGASLCEGLN